MQKKWAAGRLTRRRGAQLADGAIEVDLDRPKLLVRALVGGHERHPRPQGVLLLSASPARPRRSRPTRRVRRAASLVSVCPTTPCVTPLPAAYRVPATGEVSARAHTGLRRASAGARVPGRVLRRSPALPSEAPTAGVHSTRGQRPSWCPQPMRRFSMAAFRMASRLDKFGTETVWQEVRAGATRPPPTPPGASPQRGHLAATRTPRDGR
jgi:hypothetical protein